MKKWITALLLFSVLLTSCTQVKLEPALQKLPEQYTLEEAKNDGCVVYEDLDITFGQEIWDAFLTSVEEKKSCAVRRAIKTRSRPSFRAAIRYPSPPFRLFYAKSKFLSLV